MPTTLGHLRSSLTRDTFRTLNRVAIPVVKSGIGAPLPVGFGLVVLETTGRISGQPRQVPLVAARFGQHVKVGTLRRRSQWVKNLEAHPQAAVWIGGRRRDATSSVDSGALDVASLVFT